jgi:23S rRNA pseudouridine1911/1915/1917 synthase
VLLAARTPEAWKALRAQFSGGGDAKKLYLALVEGPIADEGEIEIPLAQHGDRVRPALASDTEARPATSSFRVLTRDGARSFVEVQIFTGVMHQVRAHLAGIGAPIVGDALYGGAVEPRLSRFFLHAAVLEITHPTTGLRLRVESQLPRELRSLVPSDDQTFGDGREGLPT